MNKKSLTALLATAGLAISSSQAALIAYYPLDGNFDDASGNGNNGTMFGGVSYDNSVPGAIGGGQSAAFDGAAGTYGSIAGGLGVTSNPEFTVAMWVNGVGTANRDKRVFSEGSSTDNNPLFNVGTHNGGADGSVDIYVRNGGQIPHTYSNNKNAFDGTWRHVAVTGGADKKVDIFIDGVFDSTVDHSAVDLFAGDTTTIGGILRSADCCNFTGGIDDVSFWSQTLDEGQIGSLANGTAATAIVPEPSSTLLVLASVVFGIGRRRR